MQLFNAIIIRKNSNSIFFNKAILNGVFFSVSFDLTSFILLNSSSKTIKTNLIYKIDT